MIEILIAIAIIAIGAIWYYNRKSPSFDINNDGKVDVQDAKAAVENTVAAVKAEADLNKDGKVDSADVAVAAEKVKTGAKKAATKAKETVKKTAGRKPKSKT